MAASSSPKARRPKLGQHGVRLQGRIPIGFGTAEDAQAIELGRHGVADSARVAAHGQLRAPLLEDSADPAAGRDGALALGNAVVPSEHGVRLGGLSGKGPPVAAVAVRVAIGTEALVDAGEGVRGELGQLGDEIPHRLFGPLPVARPQRNAPAAERLAPSAHFDPHAGVVLPHDLAQFQAEVHVGLGGAAVAAAAAGIAGKESDVVVALDGPRPVVPKGHDLGALLGVVGAVIMPFLADGVHRPGSDARPRRGVLA